MDSIINIDRIAKYFVNKLLMNPLRVAVMSELFMRTPRELLPRRLMMRWKGSVFFKTPVRAMSAITVRMEGLKAVA